MSKHSEKKLLDYKCRMDKRYGKMIWIGEVPVILDVPFSIRSKCERQRRQDSDTKIRSHNSE